MTQQTTEQEAMNEPIRNRTVLGADCKIAGELTLNNDALIMGQFEGTLNVSGVLDLTHSSRVSGRLNVGTLRLAGTVDADVVATHGIELLAGSKINGNIYSPRLSVTEPAVIEGQICIGPNALHAAEEQLSAKERATASSKERTGSSRKNDKRRSVVSVEQPVVVTTKKDVAQPGARTASEQTVETGVKGGMENRKRVKILSGIQAKPQGENEPGVK